MPRHEVALDQPITVGAIQLRRDATRKDVRWLVRNSDGTNGAPRSMVWQLWCELARLILARDEEVKR